jgi:hypothetical protein
MAFNRTSPCGGRAAAEVEFFRFGCRQRRPDGANLNSPDGSYQGPTTIVGQGQFTATNSDVHASFVALPSGWPVLGVGAEAAWEYGVPHSVALTYVQLAYDPWVWWCWLIPVLNILTRPFS